MKKETKEFLVEVKELKKMSILLMTYSTLQCCSANEPCRPDGQTPCPLTAHPT